MKKTFTLLMAVIMFYMLAPCAFGNGTSPQSQSNLETGSSHNNDSTEFPASTEEDERDAESTEYAVEKLNGSIRVPNGYYVFGEDIEFTEQMCEDIGTSIENVRKAIPLLQGQTLIVPSDEAFAESVHFYLKVKEKKYDDITLSELPMSDYRTVASTIVSSFGVRDYETVEGNGLRFFVFTADQGLGAVLRYATILNGHMIYVYANNGNNTFTEQQKSDLEYIALSIRHSL